MSSSPRPNVNWSIRSSPPSTTSRRLHPNSRGPLRTRAEIDDAIGKGLLTPNFEKEYLRIWQNAFLIVDDEETLCEALRFNLDAAEL